jgi:2-dehydropantoate 2-reductase
VTGSGPVRVAVIGCGAIGSLYAAHLARVPGVEVWAVDPWAEHVRAMQAGGLRVTGLADFTAPVQARTDGRELPACDFGLVATKAGHTAAAVTGAGQALAGAAVVSVQNGLGNEEIIAERVPRVIRGSIITAGSIEAPGVVRYDAPGDSWFGPFEPRPASMDEVSQLAGLLTEGGLRTHALADARGPQWTKVIFNAATSPLSALTGLPVGPVCTDEALRAQVDGLITEALAVCERAGITLPTATSRACSRMCWPAGRPRSTCSTAGSPPRDGGPACPRRGTTAWLPWSKASSGPGRRRQRAAWIPAGIANS